MQTSDMPGHSPTAPSSPPPQSFPELLRQVGARIRELRERQALTLELLGETVGLNAGGMSRIENGRKNFTLKTVNRIALGIGVHTREFFVPPKLSELEPGASKSHRRKTARPRAPVVVTDDGSLQELLEHIGSRIRELRELQGLSIQVLADYVGIVPHALGAIEAGKTNLTIRTADRIAQGIGVYTYELFIARERSEIQLSSSASTARAAKKKTAGSAKRAAGSAKPAKKGARRVG